MSIAREASDSRRSAATALNLRAVWTGATVDIAGSLVMSTIVGIAAITGMLVRGESAETIVADLPASQALLIFVAAGGLLMSLAGGYVAANIANAGHLRHALWAGLLSTLLNIAMVWLVGDSGPFWLTGTTMLLIVPCAILGGWLATPVQRMPL